MWILCHYVRDMSAQSFLIVHQLVMCQNFLMLRYPMLIADGAGPFFSKGWHVEYPMLLPDVLLRRTTYKNIAADAQPSPLADV